MPEIINRAIQGMAIRIPANATATTGSNFLLLLLLFTHLWLKLWRFRNNNDTIDTNGIYYVKESL